MVLKGILKNKRGIFFTSLVIIIISLFFLTYTFYSVVDKRESIHERIKSMNDFVHFVENDLTKKLKTTGFRIIFLFEKRIAETGQPITNLESTFKEAFLNGTIYGETNDDINLLLNGATLFDILDDFKDKGNKINLNVNFSNVDIFLEQNDPWKVDIIMYSDMLITDKNGLAMWNKSENITAYLEIENFEDPLYVLNTNGIVSNKIRKTPYSVFVSESDISNLSNHALNSFYINSSDAPSFLNRLEGINSNNPQGIESLVNLQELSAQGISVKDKSVIDHVYFSDNNPENCNVLPPGMPSWFKLDTAHFSLYNVSGDRC